MDHRGLRFRRRQARWLPSLRLAQWPDRGQWLHTGTHDGQRGTSRGLLLNRAGLMSLRRGRRVRERGGRNADHHGRWDNRGDSGPQHRLVWADDLCRATGARWRLILIALQRPRAGGRARSGFTGCKRSDLWAGGRIWRGRGTAGGAWRRRGKLRVRGRGGRRSRRYSGLAAALGGHVRVYLTRPAGRIIRRCPAAQALRLEARREPGPDRWRLAPGTLGKGRKKVTHACTISRYRRRRAVLKFRMSRSLQP